MKRLRKLTRLNGTLSTWLLGYLRPELHEPLCEQCPTHHPSSEIGNEWRGRLNSTRSGVVD